MYQEQAEAFLANQPPEALATGNKKYNKKVCLWAK